MPTPEETTAKPTPEQLEQLQGIGAKIARRTALIDSLVADSRKTEDVEAGIVANKELRRDLDWQLQKLKGLPPSRHRAIAITHLEDVIMRLGMDLKRLNELRPTPEPSPYPSSYDPSNTKVEPTEGGLKL